MKNSMLLTVCASAAMFATVAMGEVGPNEVVFDSAGAVAAPLTDKAGVPANGQKVMINRRKGNCFACHKISAMSDVPFHGAIGPSLDGVATRYDVDQLRGILVNAHKVFDGTVMPPFYVDTGYPRVAKKFKGKTNLTAQDVEDVLSYLQTLTE